MFNTNPHLGWFPFLNTGIHTIMYLYYYLSTLGPNVQKYLWWKKYLTQVQLIQFVLLGVHSCYLYTLPKTDYNVWFASLQLFNAVMYILLFSSFYVKSYVEKRLEKNQLTKCE